jgi:hypothetical protein
MTVYHSSVAALHITNGSCAGDLLKTFVDGPVVLTCDVLHEGPAPRIGDDQWHDLRARFLYGDGGGTDTVEGLRADLARSDHAIRHAAARGDDVVLWFEHDLFDQLLLIRTLDLMAREPGAGSADTPRPISLICIDRFPGVERFIGLGQLAAAQLASLYPARTPVTREQFALASSAWERFRASDPRALVDLVARLKTDEEANGALPFLADAMSRFLAEFPSVESGLTRSETLALTVLSDGPMNGGALFFRTQKHEPRPFMGDSTFFSIVTALADARVPLLAISGPPDRADLRAHTVAILDAGREVLAGRQDRVRLNGIDMWRGGVHLEDGGRVWRWDGSRETLVS